MWQILAPADSQIITKSLPKQLANVVLQENNSWIEISYLVLYIAEFISP